MNIKEAKTEIADALRTYLEKNEEGEYGYPVVRQRPILLMGPPGIGKTAIMEQVARENQVGLVSYTITHHTRQSAVGLPRIRERQYEDKEFSVTEYTMSEIIDAVYRCMQQTGKKEGILFIDEINCASETLAPTMLQFLQNKTFGSHKVPEGWMIVAAGNPPEYNKSVREFDIVTLDRVRRIDVEADVSIWLDYARNSAVHGAVLSYLGMKKENFYLIEREGTGMHFVTARGWEDLSELIKAYERFSIPVTEKQILQFLQKEEIAENFAAYYQIYRKYGQDYAIVEILKGELSDEAYKSKVELAKRGSFEERFTVTELVLSSLNGEAVSYHIKKTCLDMLYRELCRIKESRQGNLEEYAAKYRHSIKVRQEADILSAQEVSCEKWVVRKLEEIDRKQKEEHLYEWDQAYEKIREIFAAEKRKLESETENLGTALKHSFGFLKDSFGDGQEMLMFLTGLSKNDRIMEYIADCGCDDFFLYSDRLLYKKRNGELLEECKKIIAEV